MKLTIGGFTGANKAADPKLLADSVGVDSRNQKPGRGNLRPWKQPLTVATIPTGRQTIYRYARDVKSDANYWFSWNTVVHAVRGYNQDDTTERTFFTGSGAPKWVDNTFALAGAPYPTATRTLGVPAPVTAAVLTSNANGVSTNNETRAVTYTYVTTKGDESAPAPTAEVVLKTDDTLTASALAAAPGGFDINRIRVYMTVSGQSGDAEFFFQKEIASGTASTVVSTKSTAEVMQTTGWLPPPADLSYLTPMWNGMLAGITNGRVVVCEAYKPYAWKPENDFPPPDASAVALGRVGEQSLLVLTTGRPAIMTGTSPDSLDLQPLELREACIAPRAVVSFGHGVAWPCEDGLAYYGAGGPKMLTAGLFTRDDWQALNPTGMVAASYEGAYLCFYTDGLGARRGFIIDPTNPAGIFFLDTGYDALYFDELQDALYVYESATGNVKKWDAGAAAMTAVYRSKVFVTPPVNFGWSRIEADSYPVTVKVDAGPFEAAARTKLLAARPSLSAVGTDTVRFTKAVADQEPFRLPDGFEARRWQVQVETDGAAVQPPVVLATTPEELP